MALDGTYEESPSAWVREQVAVYEATGGREGGTIGDTGLPVVIETSRGRRTGKLRKSPVMRVEHEGSTPSPPPRAGRPSTTSGPSAWSPSSSPPVAPEPGGTSTG